MSFSPALMLVGANAIRAAATKAKLHSADPTTGGTAAVTSAGTQSVAWAAATNDGDFDISAPINFTGGAANGAAKFLSLWDSTVTTWYGNFALTGDQTFNSAGEYTVNSLAQNGSAT